MTSFWALAVARDGLARTRLFEDAVPQIGDGKALLRVDRVGPTANNMTYAVWANPSVTRTSSRPEIAGHPAGD